MSSTTDTVRQATGNGGRCACGRDHPRPLRRRLRKPEPELASKLYDALIEGKASANASRYEIDYSGDCSSPLGLAANDLKKLFVRRYVRCRKCGACLRARTNYWGFAGMEQTRQSAERGLRTWFGTLTLTSDWQDELRDRAILKHSNPRAEWWADPACDERFRFIRDELVHEVQKFWKRLRKAGHRFKYLVVIERHMGGGKHHFLPHVHFLLHEQDAPIRKRDIQSAWHLGFSNVSIVGGRSAKAAAPERAAWYVVKYLSKNAQARQLASLGYKPDRRSRRHKSEVCRDGNGDPREAESD